MHLVTVKVLVKEKSEERAWRAGRRTQEELVPSTTRRELKPRPGAPRIQPAAGPLGIGPALP